MHMVEDEEPEFVPQMLAQLEDELARSRMREAFWISVLLHIVFVLLIIFSPPLLPDWAQGDPPGIDMKTLQADLAAVQG